MPNLMPVPREQFLDVNGTPLAGGKVFTYQSGTTTPQATFTDSTGITPNSNPVILDSGGFAGIWLISGQSYTIVVQDANGVQQYSVDGVVGLAATALQANPFVIDADTTSVTVNANTTLAQVIKTFNLPSGFMNLTGKTWIAETAGLLTPVNNTETVSFQFKFGTSAVAMNIVPALAQTRTWTASLRVITVTPGSSGLITGYASFSLGDPAIISYNEFSLALDLTGVITLTTVIGFSTASATNSCTTDFLLIRADN